MNSLSDNYLMLKVKSGDLDKMGLLFERYHRILFGFLYHSTANRASSEDLLQTVFYRMIKYKHTFTGEGEFRTWMYHLARNVLNDFLRKNYRIVYQEDIKVASDKAFSEQSVEIGVEKKQESEALHDALQKLNADSREVLILSRFQELSYHEIAELMNTTEGNIKVKVHRAMKELRSIYLKENY